MTNPLEGLTDQQICEMTRVGVVFTGQQLAAVNVAILNLLAVFKNDSAAWWQADPEGDLLNNLMDARNRILEVVPALKSVGED